MIIKVNDSIYFDNERICHSKASEEYVSVTMIYEENKKFEGWIPVVYRRTGMELKNDNEIKEYLLSIYTYLNPDNKAKWENDADSYFKNEKPNASVTKKVFDAIKSGDWVCVNCTIKSPNWARRFQEIKESGFTFATKTPVNCPICGKRSTYLMAIRLPRLLNISGNGYEVWSPKLRKRIISVLGNYDAYEGKVANNLLPDHKFSEIRWDENTKSFNSDDMTDKDIKDKFQLLSNQRNQQKREVCRICFQTGKRQRIFGIDYFFVGDENWDKQYPKKGKEAEQGCVGCPWYDIESWRNELNKKMKQNDN